MKQPNILFLFTDQQRHDTIGALGNDIIRTPSLNRLAREGTSFLRCYTPSPVCMSARAALVTGIPSHVSRCVDNMSYPSSATSIMEVLSAEGYQTQGIGKMHFGGDKDDWQRSWGFENRIISEEMKKEGDFVAFLKSKGFGHVIDTHGPRSEHYYLPQPSQLPAALHETTWIADRSIEFLKKRDRKRPFFMFSSFIKPHPPFEAPAPWYRLYRCAEMEPPYIPKNATDYHARINVVQNRYKYMDRIGNNDLLMRTIKAGYYASISFVDYNIGRILAALGDEIDNTLIVFSTDHGEMLGDFGCYGKRCMLEPSVRIPCLVRYPRAFPANHKSRTPVSLIDFFPTFAHAANCKDYKAHPDGESLFHLIEKPSSPRYVTSQFQERWMGHYMVTNGQWKYMYSAADRKEWLFKVNDKGRDGVNCAEDRKSARVKSELKEALRACHERAGYTDAFKGSDWRRYKAKPFPKDRDYGLLFQDESNMQSSIDALGKDYARKVTKPDGVNYQIMFDHMG